MMAVATKCTEKCTEKCTHWRRKSHSESTMNKLLTITAIVLMTVVAHANEPVVQEIETVTFSHSTLEGIGQEQGVMRRDPSDVIKVDGLYYLSLIHI